METRPGEVNSCNSVRGYIAELDGLRGIAILLVMLHHFWPTSGLLATYSSVGHLGWIGVDLFFVISGFFITGILLDTIEDRGYYRNFYARRSLRIFPLYYLFLIAIFVIPWLLPGGRHFEQVIRAQSGPAAWYFAYLGNFREAIVGKEPAYFLAPLWSLSIEEHFYLAFPFIVQKLSRERLKQLLWSLIFIAPVIRLVMMFVAPSNERIQYLATPCRVDVIAMGCLLALTLRQRTSTPNCDKVGRIALAMIAVCAAAFLLGGLDRTKSFCRVAGYSLVDVTFALIVLWAILGRGRTSVRWLRSRPLIGIGKMCYGTYLLQRPAEVVYLKIAHYVHLPADGSAMALAGKMVFAVAIAALSWHLFERQCLRLKKYFNSARHPSDMSEKESVPVHETAVTVPSPARVSA